MTNSCSLRSNSSARSRATQFHWRHFCEQNFFGRPGPDRRGTTRRHHPHRVGSSPALSVTPHSVMTKYYVDPGQSGCDDAFEHEFGLISLDARQAILAFEQRNQSVVGTLHDPDAADLTQPLR